MAKQYNITADSVQGFSNGFVIQWSGDAGFGEYTIYIDKDGKWKGDSEYMDKGEDKSFLEHLFLSIVEQIEVR